MNKIYPLVMNNGFSVAYNVDAQVEAGFLPQRWMQEPSVSRKAQPAVNANQLTSLSAMIAYTASKSGQSEYRIERGLADHFSVPNAKVLPANDFDAAIRYLADIIPM